MRSVISFGGCFVQKRGRSISAEIVTFLLALAALCLVSVSCTNVVADARALESKGDLAGAMRLYTALLKDDPDNLAALSGMGVDLMLLGRFDEALVYEERVVRLDRSDVQTRTELGFNYLNHQGRPIDAVRVLGEAAQLEGTAKNLTFLAQAQHASGDNAGAEKNLRKAVEIEKSYAYAYTLLAKLLEEQERVEEAQAVVRQAAIQGISVAESQ